jgi:hypothetical protein
MVVSNRRFGTTFALIFKRQAVFLTLEDGTDRFCRIVGRKIRCVKSQESADLNDRELQNTQKGMLM